MSHLLRYVQPNPTATSSVLEVRFWVEGLDHSFLPYGELFERGKIDGEKLLDITRKKLIELGITHTEHQDIVLQAVASISKKRKVGEEDMEREDQSDKKMSTRFGKQSEHLEHAIEHILVLISERRRARSLHTTFEQPPHNIFIAALEVINVVKMILSILERPPFDCMSEFSSLKNHLIKHITLLTHFSEQTDLSHEMESDIVDVCKGVTKICHYIMALPPDLPERHAQIPAFFTPGERPPRVQVPITAKPAKKSLPLRHGPPKYMPPIQPLSMPVTALSSSGPISSFQCMTLPTQRVLERSEHFSRERVSTPSNEGTVSPESDKRNKSETELSDTKGSETSGGSLDLKSLQELTITESDTPLLDSGSERCVIDSDSDRGISSDYDMEKYSKDSSSVIWGTDSDSEKGPRCFDSAKLLLEGKSFQIDSSFVEVLMKPEQPLVRIEECHVDSSSLRHWMDSGSEKCLGDSDSEKYLLDSDNEKLDRDSGSEKFHMTLPSEKHSLETGTSQVTLESVKCLMEAEGLIDRERVCKRRLTTSDTESIGMVTPSVSAVSVNVKEKPQKISSKRYTLDSDSELSGIDSDSEKHELGSSAVKYLIGIKPFQLGTHSESLWKDSWSEIPALNLDFESPKATDTAEQMRKARTCQGTANLSRLQIGFKPDCRRSWMEPERQKSDYEYIGRRSRSRRSQYRSIRLQDSSEECLDDFQSYWDNFERERLDSSSEKQACIEKEKDKNESKGKEHPKDTKFGNEGFILVEKREQPILQTVTDKERGISLDIERQSRESESEAHRLGARKKANRPQGFWRPLSMPLPLPQRKKTEQYIIPQRDTRVSRIQLVRYMSDDKIVRFKEESQAPRNNETSQQKTESDSHNISPDPNTFTDEKPPKKMSRKISYSKNRSQDFTSDESFQELWSQIDLTKLVSPESFMSAIPVPSCSTTSKSVTRTKVPRESTISLPMSTQRCTKCFQEIKNSLPHKCVVDSDDDSDSDHSLQVHISSETKHSPASKSRRHPKSSQKIPLSHSQDPGSPVEIRCPVHQETPKFLHCDSCVALQNLIGTTLAATLPADSQSTLGQHRTSPETEDNSDNEIKPSSPEKIRYKSSTKTKHETAREEETNSEDDADVEDETDTEDEDDSNDKKDPKDKSDPDDSEPKDGNSGSSTGSNNGSDPSSGTGPTSDANSDRDDDTNRGDDPNSAPESNMESAINDDIHSKCTANPEKVICTKIEKNASRLFTEVDFENINPDYTSDLQNVIFLDCISNNTTQTGNDIYFKIDFSPQNVRSIPNSPGPGKNDIGFNNSSSFQNSSPRIQNGTEFYYNVNSCNAIDHNQTISPNNEDDPNYDTGSTGAAGHHYKAAPNYNKYLDYVPEFIHVVFSSPVINLNYIARSSYITRSNSATPKATDTSNNTSYTPDFTSMHTANTYPFSGSTYTPRYTHFIGSSTTISPNCSTKNTNHAPYCVTTSNNNSTLLLNPELDISPLSYISNIIYRHIFNFTTDRKYTSIPSDFSIFKFYDPTKLGRNYAKWNMKKFGALSKNSPGSMDFASFKYLTESKDILDAKESDVLKYFCSLQNSIGVNDTASLKFYANPNSPLSSFGIEVAAEPDVVKSSGAVNQYFKIQLYLRRVALQPYKEWKIYILKIFNRRHHKTISNSKEPGCPWERSRMGYSLSLELRVRGIPGTYCALRHLDRWCAPASGGRSLLDKYSGALKAEGGAEGGPTEKTPKKSDKPLWRPAKGSVGVPGGRQPVRSESGLPMNRGKEPAERQARVQPLSPTRGVAVNPPRGYAVRFARSRSVSPLKDPALSPSRGRTVNPARGRSENPSRGRAMSPSRGRSANPSRGRAVKTSRDHVVSPPRGQAMIPLRGRTVSPPRGYALSPPRGHAVSPAKAPAKRHGRERALSVGRGCVDKKGRRCTVSPTRKHAVRPKQECALGPAFIRPPTRYEGKLILGSAIGVTVKPAEGYAEEFSRNANRSGRSTDNNEDEDDSSILTAFINFFMKAKAQNWLDLSWFRRVLPSFFSEEDRYFWSRNRFCAIACTELGHGKCEGWLWKKRESRGISLFSWKKYWFILKHSTLFWFSHLNDTKADGFIYLPEFRIDLAPHCRRNHAFQVTHARIKNFYFAATCSDEMKYWVGQMLQLAYGSSFGDAAANAEYRRIGAMIYANCVLSLKRDFPVLWCNNCQEATTIVSVNPNFEYRRAQNITDEFIYFRPIDEEIREKLRRQKQQKATMASYHQHAHQYTREGIHQRDLGNMSQVVMVTTPPLTKELESVALIRPKTSGLLRLEKMPVNSSGVPESQRLDVTGIASPEERGKGTAILVAGVPGKEIDDTEIPTLKFTGLIHLEALINKCSPSSEYSRPRSPRNLWLESPENAESPGSDDLEVARSMIPLRERSIFRRSWAELLDAPLNSEGLHVLETSPTEEERDNGYFQLSPYANQATSPPTDSHLQSLQGPFPLLPQRPKLQRQRSNSLPSYKIGRSQNANASELKSNPNDTRFFQSDDNLLAAENVKKGDNIQKAWQKPTLSTFGEQAAINPSFKNFAKLRATGLPNAPAGLAKDNVGIPKNTASNVSMVCVGIPRPNPEILYNNARVPMGNLQIPRGSGGIHTGSAFRGPVDNVQTPRHNVRASAQNVSSALSELSKIGEHQL
ncbi:uncharacterized protein RHO17_003829 [Thomomys bottae]